MIELESEYIHQQQQQQQQVVDSDVRRNSNKDKLSDMSAILLACDHKGTRHGHHHCSDADKDDIDFHTDVDYLI